MRQLKTTTMKKLNFLFFFVFLISVNQKLLSQNLGNEFKLSSSEFQILSFDKNWNWIFTNGTSTSLDKDELVKIENILNVIVKEHNEQEKLELDKHNKKFPDNYRKHTGYEISLEGKMRQYVPIVNEKGEKEIWINFFCDKPRNDEWKTVPRHVSDGGNCYFSVKVNLTKKTFKELIVNGYA